MLTLPHETISGIEVSTEKFWRWLAVPLGQLLPVWSWDTTARPIPIAIQDGDRLNLNIQLNRANIRQVDAFQIWLMNLTPLDLAWDFADGKFAVYLNDEWIREHHLRTPRVPDWGTNVILNFDDSELKHQPEARFRLEYSGNPLLVKSVEVYAITERFTS